MKLVLFAFLAATCAGNLAERFPRTASRAAADPRYNCDQASDCVIKQNYCYGYYLACANSDSVFKSGESCTITPGSYLRSPPTGCGCSSSSGRCITVHSYSGGGRGLTPEAALNGAEDDARNSGSGEGMFDCEVVNSQTFQSTEPEIGTVWRAQVDIECSIVY